MIANADSVNSDRYREAYYLLNQIEVERGVRVLYACEAGSRAWGFASPDSDYDVRFIYIHPTEWYLSIDLEQKRDVIERPIDNGWDISGWELRKALKLFAKSNPPLLEWLESPIIYRESASLADGMRELTRLFYRKTACAYHHWHMAKKNYREYLRNQIVWRKKYFYVLRPLLAIRWLDIATGPPPVSFETLLEWSGIGSDVEEAIRKLLEAKRSGAELGYGPRIPVISCFMEKELKSLADRRFASTDNEPDRGLLDELFRDTLEEAWE